MEVIHRIQGVKKAEEQRGDKQPHAKLNSEKLQWTPKRLVDPRLNISPVEDLLTTGCTDYQP
jgi:hypothetical protein